MQPYTTPYTVHPTPYTLHRTPYTVHPTPYSTPYSTAGVPNHFWLVDPLKPPCYFLWTPQLNNATKGSTWTLEKSRGYKWTPVGNSCSTPYSTPFTLLYTIHPSPYSTPFTLLYTEHPTPYYLFPPGFNYLSNRKKVRSFLKRTPVDQL